MVCDYRPLKEEKFRFRITVGRDRLPNHLDTSYPEADLFETKVILNSVISDSSKGARFVSLVIKDYLLVTPMKDPECMRVKHKHVQDGIRTKYNIDQLVTNAEWVIVKIQKGMPGLRQSVILAYWHIQLPSTI